MDIGSVVIWEASLAKHKSENKLANRKPNYLIILEYVGEHSCRVVPAWIDTPGYTICVFAKPKNLYVDASKMVTIPKEQLHLCEEYVLLDKFDAIKRIKDKNEEIKEKKKLTKIERKRRKAERVAKKAAEEKKQRELRRAHRREIENVYGRMYEIAVMNNDKKKMREIEEKIGHDPRPKKSVKSGSKLSRVTNFKPCVGGRVSPK